MGANDYVTKPFTRRALVSRIRTHVQISQMNKAFMRFVPHQFLAYLNVESIERAAYGKAVEMAMSVVFSDIRSFGVFSQAMTANENFDFINRYLRFMEPAVVNNKGFIDKFIGSTIMSLFGSEKENGAEASTQAAIDMCRALDLLNQGRSLKERIDIAVGVNTGMLMLGMVGGANKLEGTVISDNVNLASRTLGLAKTYNCRVIMTGNTKESLSPDHKFLLRFLAKVCVKGKKLPVDVWEVVDGQAPPRRDLIRLALASYNRAIEFYFDKNFSECLKHMDAVKKILPDPVTELYRTRCLEYIASGTPEGWTGVEYPDK